MTSGLISAFPPTQKTLPSAPSAPRARACAGFALAVAAAWADLPAAFLLAPGQAPRGIARARHMAFYLAHVTYGLSQHEVARRFRRHRASIAYGCRRIEEAREEAGFDQLVTRLEGEARRVAGLAGFQEGGR